MASNLGKVPILRAIQARGYAHAAPVSGISNYEVKTTILPNKLCVASAENNSPLCRISILYKAGSRNETPDNAGATHMLRIAAGLSTKNASQFAITRNIQQVGASLSCMTDRETVSYTVEGTRQAMEYVMPYLTEVATQQVFKPWELSDNIPRVRYELATRPPQQRAVDLLHKAAYRRGLGNSIYLSKHQIGKISTETLQHYVHSNFRSGGAAVVGLGVDHNVLSQYATSLQMSTGDGGTQDSKYNGGEIRSDKGGDYAFIALALPTSGFHDAKEALAYGVLQRALGSGINVKFCGSAGILAKANGTGNFAVSALNISYSDNGLFGALIAAESKEAERVVKTTAGLLQGIHVTDEDVNRGKNLLKMYYLSKAESGSEAIHVMGLQAVHERNVSSFDEVVSQIDSISTGDVAKAASKLSTGGMSIAAVGNLTNVPFLDTL